MIKRSIITLSLTLLVILAQSCDPYGGYEYWIDNKSDSTLYVSFHELEKDSTIHIEVENNSSKLLAEYSTINGLYDRGDDFLNDWCENLTICLDSAQGTIIKKEYLKRASWSYDQNPTGMFGKAGDNIYRLSITNEDLKE